MTRTIIGFLLGGILGGAAGPLGTFIYMGILRPRTQAPRPFFDALIMALHRMPEPLIAGALAGGVLLGVIFALAGGRKRVPEAPRWPPGFEVLCEALSRAYADGVPSLERRPLVDLLAAKAPPAMLARILAAALGPKHGLTLNDPTAGQSSEEARSVVRERLAFFGFEG